MTYRLIVSPAFFLAASRGIDLSALSQFGPLAITLDISLGPIAVVVDEYGTVYHRIEGPDDIDRLGARFYRERIMVRANSNGATASLGEEQT